MAETPTAGVAADKTLVDGREGNRVVALSWTNVRAIHDVARRRRLSTVMTSFPPRPK
jgi:hypothetical protein